MNWFRKKKEPEVIHHKYDIVPPFDWEKATSETATAYFEKLTRIQMLEVYDRDLHPEHLWDEFFEVLNKIDNWPTDNEVISVCNEVKWNSNDIITQFKALQRQVEGIQTKLDKVEVLISNAEFKLCGKDALKL